MGADATKSARGRKSADAFRTISEVSESLEVPQHVLRFWETKFTQVSPMKRAGGRRYYRPEDLALLTRIRDLLYNEGYTIRGVQKLLREKGSKQLVDNGENNKHLDNGGADLAGGQAFSDNANHMASGVSDAVRDELCAIRDELQAMHAVLQEQLKQ